MLLSLRTNGLASLFKEVRVFKGGSSDLIFKIRPYSISFSRFQGSAKMRSDQIIRSDLKNVEKDRGLYQGSTSECSNLLRSLSDPHTTPPNSTCWDEVDLNHDGTKPSHPLDTCSIVPTPPLSQWQESVKGIGP